LPKPLILSVLDYPALGRLVPGQKLTLKFKVTAGMRNLVNMDELIDLVPDAMDVELDSKRLSPQEVMLASINESMNRQTIATP